MSILCMDNYEHPVPVLGLLSASCFVTYALFLRSLPPFVSSKRLPYLRLAEIEHFLPDGGHRVGGGLFGFVRRHASICWASDWTESQRAVAKIDKEQSITGTGVF